MKAETIELNTARGSYQKRRFPCRQKGPSSKRSFLNTLPSSKYQYPFVEGGIVFVCDDRQTPDPLARVVTSEIDDETEKEVAS